ncbi:MAG: YncE family protein [Wenzhouxiangella sp.]
MIDTGHKQAVAAILGFLWLVLVPCSVSAEWPVADQLELDPGQIAFQLVDDQRDVIYLGVSDDDGQSSLLRIKKDGLVSDGSIGLGLVDLRTGVLSAAGNYAFVGLDGDPGKILKIDLDEYGLVDELTLSDGQTLGAASLSSLSGDTVYMALMGNPGRLISIDATSFAVTDMLQLEDRETGFQDVVLDPKGRFAYWAANFNAQLFNFPSIVKVDLETFERVAKLDLIQSAQAVVRLMMDPAGESLWAWGIWSPSSVIEVDLDGFELSSRLVLPAGFSTFSTTMVMEPSGLRALFVNGAEPPTLLRVDLQEMELMDSEALSDDSLDRLRGGVASANQASVYFHSLNDPPRLIHIDSRKPFLRFSPSRLDFGESLIDVPAMPRTVRLENTGSTLAEHLEWHAPSPSVSVATQNCPAHLEPGAGCDITLLFEASAVGPNDAVFEALAANTAVAAIPLQTFGQTSMAMGTVDWQFIGPDWLAGDVFELSKPLMRPNKSAMHVWLMSPSEAIDSVIDTQSLAFLPQQTLGVWEASVHQAAFADQGAVVYAALEEFDGISGNLGRGQGQGFPYFTPVLFPEGGFDPISAIAASSNEDRVWFASGTTETRLFSVDGTDFSIDGELLLGASDGVGSMALNEQEDTLLLALTSDPTRIVEVNLEDLSVGRVLELPLIEGRLEIALVDSESAHAYFISNAVPTEVVKIDFSGLTLLEMSVQSMISGQVLDGRYEPASDQIYLISETIDSVKLSRLNTESLLAEDQIQLDSAFRSISGAALTADGSYALFPALADDVEISDRVTVVRVRLTSSELMPEPSVIAFGDLPQFGSMETAEVWLQNDGSRSASQLNLLVPDGPYRLSFSDCPDELPPGEGCRMNIAFEPKIAGPQHSVLYIHTADGAPELLPLSANVIPPVFRDRFEGTDGKANKKL